MSELRTPGDVPPPGHKGWIPALADVQGVRILSSDSGGRRGVEPVHQGLAATNGAFAADVTAASCRPQLMSVRALELGRATRSMRALECACPRAFAPTQTSRSPRPGVEPSCPEHEGSRFVWSLSPAVVTG